MKKILFLALFGSTMLHAQVREKNNFEITPYHGISLSAFTGKEDNYIPKENQKINSLLSASFGIGANVYLNDRLSIRSGLSYQRMGSEGFVYENPYNGRGSYVSQKISYITIPMHLNYHFAKKRNWNVFLGPSLSFTGKSTSNDLDMKDYINEFQVGAGYGFAYKFVINERVGIGLMQDNFLGLTYVPKNRISGDGYGNRTEYQQKIKNIYSSINVQFTYLLQ